MAGNRFTNKQKGPLEGVGTARDPFWARTNQARITPFNPPSETSDIKINQMPCQP